LTPAIYLSELKYVIRINALPETSLTYLHKENDTYKTENVIASYGGKYFYYTIKLSYVYLCRFIR